MLETVRSSVSVSQVRAALVSIAASGLCYWISSLAALLADFGSCHSAAQYWLFAGGRMLHNGTQWSCGHLGTFVGMTSLSISLLLPVLLCSAHSVALW